MEKDAIKLNDFIENPEQYFGLLKPAIESRTDIHKIEINIEGYRELFCMIMDLLKVGMLALDGMEDSCRHTERYVGSLLKVIEMLIPLEEGELLDILHIKYLNEKKTIDSN
jgi:hypothetical protein